MPDPATVLATAKTGMEIGQGALAGWGWLNKWRYGTVAITHPHNRTPVPPGHVEIEGTHNNAKGTYWLLTIGKDEHWVKCRIELHPDGRWKERIHIGDHAGPRLCFVSVVWVSDFMHSILTDIRHRTVKGNVWIPIKMNPPKNHYSVVNSIVLQVQ
jgi:hypothetical protein